MKKSFFIYHGNDKNCNNIEKNHQKPFCHEDENDKQEKVNCDNERKKKTCFENAEIKQLNSCCSNKNNCFCYKFIPGATGATGPTGPTGATGANGVLNRDWNLSSTISSKRK